MGIRVGLLDGESAYTLELPFCPQRGTTLLFTPPGSEKQVRFKVSKIGYDCDLEEAILEGEILQEE